MGGSVVLTDARGLDPDHPLVREAVRMLIAQVNEAPVPAGELALRLRWDFESIAEGV